MWIKVYQTLVLIELDKCLKKSCDLCVCNVHTGANVIALSEPEEAPGGKCVVHSH